jgi:2-polyprenyl-3-methyl-5-hydroxy-6-metoxy-1,4-benzoquinol methylase
MDPRILGTKYDAIAEYWHETHDQSDYGVNQCQRALDYRSTGGRALDVGCGAGGRFVRRMIASDYTVLGMDVSKEMIRLASHKHPNQTFLHEDVCHWQSDQRFDFILAWDSIFHLPLVQQRPVLVTLCQALAPGGVLMYTFGNATGEITDQWRGDEFYYSSIGIADNLNVLMDNGLTVLHLELDQYPQPHVYVISSRLPS